MLISSEGAWYSVTLYLPSAGPAPTHQPRAEVTPRPRPETGGRILVVEDNPLVGQMASAMLSSMGYSAVVVIDASSAIAEMERGDPISLLLTDILLPGGMTGIDLARQARRRWPDLPILFMSGFADPSLVPDDFGTNTRLLRKPFRVGQLSEAIVFALAGTKVT